MKKIIVKFHEINPQWPELVMESYEQIPEGFVEMTIEEYNQIMALVKAEMDAYFDELNRLAVEQAQEQ